MLLIRILATLLLCSTLPERRHSSACVAVAPAAAGAAAAAAATPTIATQQQQYAEATLPMQATAATGARQHDAAENFNATATAAALINREVIGATSLAAAAGAAAVMTSDMAMALSTSASMPSGSGGVNDDNELIGGAINIKVANTTTKSDSSRGHIQGGSGSGSGSGSGANADMINKSANLLLDHLQQPSGHIVNLTRQHDADIFSTSGVNTCNADTCVGLSSGTAGLDLQYDASGSAKGANVAVLSTHADSADQLARRNKPTLKLVDRNVAHGAGDTCQCRCLPYLSTYREDLGICVDDIHECTLSPFVSGSSSEKIPFVFLPLRGQIIYPSREISFPDIRTPMCAVTGAQYLSTNGWSDLRNPIDTDYPFRMFRDEGRTFLQWLGEADLRQKMQGRLIVVHLVCRDMTIHLNATSKEHLMPPKNVFSPCVAFRVNGTPVKYTNNVSEVLFQSEATATLASTSDGMSTKEYVVIGVCSLLLGLIYVSSVFLYLHMKKRKNRDQSHIRSSMNDLANDINYPKNDQVTFGAPFNRSGSLYSATSMGTSNEPRSRASIGSLKEEMGIIKNNPLLQHFPQLGEHNSGFASDISNSNSECEMDGGFHDKLKQLQTSALVHPQMSMSKSNSSPCGSPKSASGKTCVDQPIEPSASPTQENECLPPENVSIVEDMMTEEKMEHLRAMVNGNVRKKLYFNPAYFEPHLLAQPPPAAIEFLQKIREVIAIAKYKMATKRYQPSLIMIPEEGMPRSSTSSLYGSQSQQPQTSTECLGCVNNRCSGHIKNCGDKRNSIEMWLQTVTNTDENSGGARGGARASTSKQQQMVAANVRRQSPPAASPAQQRRRSNSRSPMREEQTSSRKRPPPPPAPNAAAIYNSSSSNNSQCGIYNSSSAASSHATSANNVDVMPSTSTASYQLYCSTNSISSGASVTIPINRNYKSFSALSAAANMYGFAETGSEIYNNPKFSLHDSPANSQRSHSSSHRSKASSARKRQDTLQHYATAATPTSLTSAERQHYQMLRSMKQLPPHIQDYDSLGREYNATLNAQGGFQLDIPTPDYDSTIEKKIKDIYNNTQSSAPSVPTPDYSTLSRKSLKQVQPDSPIYRRKSPQYLIVDYETDSLERLEATKRKSSQSSSSPSSDVSSQLSPSLSTALPLEEELEISHTVYDKAANGFRVESGLKKKPVTKTDSNASKQKEIAARIKYDTPFRGSMTIEVEHEPQSDLERSTDSDQFEPDTLDRKPRKQSFCDITAWSGQLKPTPNTCNDSNVSLPAVQSVQETPGGLRQSSHVHSANNSFRSQGSHSSASAYESNVELRVQQRDDEKERRPSFSSLREIYQSPLVRQNSQQSCKCGGQYATIKAAADAQDASNAIAVSEQGRLLTLEAKQKRRQQVIESPTPPPPAVVEISKVLPNKTTIKITTPKGRRANTCGERRPAEAAVVAPQQHNGHCTPPPTKSNIPKGFYELTKNAKATAAPTSPSTPAQTPTASRAQSQTPVSTLNSTTSKASSAAGHKQRTIRSPLPPPPPPPPTSASTTLTSQQSRASTQHSPYQNHNHHHFVHHSTTNTEEETTSNHSESTEVTGVSDNLANSDFGGSCNNTLSSVAHEEHSEKGKLDANECRDNFSSRCNSINRNPNPDSNSSKYHNVKNVESPMLSKKLQHIDADYGAMFNTQINGLRSDYSLTKYLNRRKTPNDGNDDEQQSSCNETDSQLETNNNISSSGNANKYSDGETANKLDVLSIGSRSNRSSSRLSDRTKELYRNSGVPVGIAYPQRSNATSVNNNNSNNANNNISNATPTPTPPPPPPPTNTVQTVYRCEIEPVQLTHGMQIAMGLKDRAKKAKDLKNAWKKFVSMAAAKFSPTHSPAPPYDKKPPSSFLEALERDEGISSLIDEHPRVSTPKSSYSAPASQNYYEQRFGARPQEMDSGYMSADSGEVYKRSFYDRYNFKMMSGRDHIIRVDTIEDNSDGGSTITDRHNGSAASARRGSILDSNRFEDFEHMGEPPSHELTMARAAAAVAAVDDNSDAESDKTLTHSSAERGENERNTGTLNLYSSEEDDEQGRGQTSSPSYGSSETDGETNAEDMWESGAESIETHSVLYKNVRKS